MARPPRHTSRSIDGCIRVRLNDLPPRGNGPRPKRTGSQPAFAAQTCGRRRQPSFSLFSPVSTYFYCEKPTPGQAPATSPFCPSSLSFSACPSLPPHLRSFTPRWSCSPITRTALLEGYLAADYARLLFLSFCLPAPVSAGHHLPRALNSSAHDLI